MRLFKLSFALIIITTIVGTAQDSLRPRYGVNAGLAINRHSVDFRALPGIPNCCPLFESGTGSGIHFGLFYELPLNNSFVLSTGLNYINQSALLSALEPVSMLSGGTLVNGTFEHKIDATLGNIGFEPALHYQLVRGMFVGLGMRVAMVLSAKYSQSEQIIAPANSGTFLDSVGNDSGLRTRNVRSGDLPEATSVLVQGIASIEYELALNTARTMLVAPGISYVMSFNNLVQGYTWKPNSLRLSVALKYSPLPSKLILRDTIFHRDTTVSIVSREKPASTHLTKEEYSTQSTEDATVVYEHISKREQYVMEIPKVYKLEVQLKVAGLDNNQEEPMVTLRIEEFLQTNTYPLLGYVFFDEKSSAIASRYVRVTPEDAQTFRPESLFSEDALGISHNVLNIIGSNMHRFSKAVLNLTGCNADNGTEKGNRTLSHDRAEAVKKYLMDVWNVEDKRLIVSDRNLPETPSNSRTVDGSEENRRVEIVSNVPEVTDVFVANDTARTSSPPSIRFKPLINTTESIASWKLVVRQRDNLLKEFSGVGTPPAVVDWDLNNERGPRPAYSEPVVSELQVVTSNGERSSGTATIETNVLTIRQKRKERTKDYQLERYNLVLFEVGKSTITENHKRTVALIQSHLKANSSVTVEGYTDRSGDAISNKRLSLNRAQATANSLGLPNAKVIGVGKDRLLYPNDTPEGRFYCRTVQIAVKTPIEN